MGIYLIEENKNCEWRALYVGNGNSFSSLDGNNDLIDYACFVLRP